MSSYVRLFYLALILGICLPTPAMACTQNEAFNKMMALGRANQAMLRGAGQDRAKQITAADMATEVTSVSDYLAKEKYAEACKYYDAIARKYSIDMEEAAEGMITMEELAKDGGRRGGRCSQADASKKVMEITNVINDKVAMGDVSGDVLKRFLAEAGKHNDLIYANPSAYCDEIDKIKKKYIQ